MRLQDLSLSAVVRTLKLKPRPKRGECPQCHHHSLAVQEQSYRCWHCGLRGGVVDYVALELKVSTSEAYKILKSKMQLSDPGDTNRRLALEKVLDLCLKHKQQAVAYLESRKLDADSIVAGYCPEGLLEQHFSKQELINYGLGSENGFNLLTNRVVFPIQDSAGNLAHFQGRSLEPEDEIRWLSTRGPLPITDYLYLHHQAKCHPGEVLFICEGISDTLSLYSLGFTAVGTFGIQVDYSVWLDLFERFRYIVLCYDGDRYAFGHRKARRYKSWPSVLQNWSYISNALKERRKDLVTEVYCLVPPADHKDINDWLVEGLTADTLVRHVLACPTVQQFALSALPLPDYLTSLVRLMKSGSDEKALSAFRELGKDNWLEMMFEMVV